MPTHATGGFDVVYNNSLHRLALQRTRAKAVPGVTSLHVPLYHALHWFVKESAGPQQASVLYDGIDPSAWPFQAMGDGSAVWCGRITPNKGTHLAVEAARRLFGTIEDPGYWDTTVKPAVRDGIRYAGHLHAAARASERSRATVLLFTPCWDQPFGLVATEAVACGLPVASIDRGAAREVIGEAGAFVPPNGPSRFAARCPACG